MATKSTLEGVRTVFPSTCTNDSRVGMLADRYTSYDAIPLLKRAGAVQCGAAGYWYTNADLLATLRDEYDRTTDQVVKVVDDVRQGAENLLSGAGKWVLVAAAAYVLLPLLFRPRGGR